MVVHPFALAIPDCHLWLPDRARKSSMTSDSWYIFRNEQRIGPVTEAQLLDFLANGSVLRSDLVWRPGLPRWTPAERLPEFAELRPPPLPPQAFAQQLTPPPLPKGFAAAPAGRDSFPNPGQAPRTEGHLARPWLGQLSLPVSFWSNGFLGSLVVTLSQFGGRGCPQIQRTCGISAGDAEGGKYPFRVLRDGRELKFSGGLT